MVQLDPINAVGSLVDPVRRSLYEFVIAQPEPVGRELAAKSVGISVHKAKFHLDRLVADGVLASDYRRLTGKTGPGAGRPAKVYFRAEDSIAVSLPDRRYELMGGILASAIEHAGAIPELQDALAKAARQAGEQRAVSWSTEGGRDSRGEGAGSNTRGMLARDSAVGFAATEGALAREGLTGEAVEPDGSDATSHVYESLQQDGYEPFREGSAIRMRNCPFHALSRDHRDLVCGINHAYISGVLDGFECRDSCASLEPTPGLCCVAVRPVTGNAESADRGSGAVGTTGGGEELSS